MGTFYRGQPELPLLFDGTIASGESLDQALRLLLETEETPFFVYRLDAEELVYEILRMQQLSSRSWPRRFPSYARHFLWPRQS